MKGNITMTGYWPDSPDRNNDFNVIPSNEITMKRMKQPLVGVSNTGDTRIMYPGEEHQFDGNYVVEMPLNKMNGKITDPTVIQRLIDNHKQKYMRKGGSLRIYQGDEEPSTVLPMMPITGVPYAIQTSDSPYSWQSLPKEITSGKAYNAYNVNSNAGTLDGTMAFDPRTSQLASSFPVVETAYGLPQATIVGTPNRAGKYAKEFMTKNPDANKWGDSADPNSPVTEKFLGSLLGIGKTETNPYTGQDWGYYNRQTNYQNAKNDYIAENLLATNPQGSRSRQEWLASFSPEELEILKQSRKYSGEVAPNRWKEGFQGLNNFLGRIADPMNVQGLEGGYQGRPELFKDELSSAEAQDAGALAALGMLAIPAQGVQGLITEGSGRGFSGASPIDYTEGRDEVADLASEIALDPLNLMGLGIGKGVVEALPDASKLADAALYGTRLGTELGASGTAEVLARLNQRLAKNKGVFSRVPGPSPREGFVPNPYVTAMDEEAARIGVADYYGTTQSDKLRMVANSKLPFDELKRVARQLQLDSHITNAPTREALIQRTENVLEREAAVKTLEPEVKRSIFENLYEMQTGYKPEDVAHLHPTAKNVDEFLQAEGFNDDMLSSLITPELRRQINMASPNNTYEDRIASGFKSGKASAEQVIDPATRPAAADIVPPDYTYRPTGKPTPPSTTSQAGTANNFDDLVGVPDSSGSRPYDGSISQKLDELVTQHKSGNMPFATIDDFKQVLRKNLESSLYNKGYSKKQISQALENVDKTVNKKYNQFLDHYTNINNNQVPSDKDIAEQFGIFLSSEFLGDFGAKNFASIANRGSVKPTVSSILDYAKKSGVEFKNAAEELLFKREVEDMLKTKGRSKADLDDFLDSRVDDPDRLHYYLNNGLNSTADAQNVRPSAMADRWANMYSGSLSSKELQQLHDFYTDAYAGIRNLLSNYNLNMTSDAVHYETMKHLTQNPENLYSLLSGHNGLGFNLQDYRDIVDKVADIKPSATGTQKQSLDDIFRKSRASARSGNFISPGAAQSLSNEASKVKQGFIDLTKPKPTSYIPDDSGAYYGRVNTVTPSVFATSFKNQREMALSVRNAFDNGFKNAKVGDVITGATNTSKDSYSLQMDYLMRIHKKNPTSTEPVFLGFKPMNHASFSDKLGFLNKEEQLNAINVKLNKLQKDTGLNFDFDTRFPYIDNTGEIMIPQWGLKKTKDVAIDISKRKYGGEVGTGLPFMGYLPIDYMKAYGA